jgi:hypothetical protein
MVFHRSVALGINARASAACTEARGGIVQGKAAKATWAEALLRAFAGHEVIVRKGMQVVDPAAVHLCKLHRERATERRRHEVTGRSIGLRRSERSIMSRLVWIAAWSWLVVATARAQEVVRTPLAVANSVQILVRDAATAMPVPNAEVWWLGHERGQSDADLADARRDPEAYVRAHGQRSLTTADGRVAVPVARWAWVVARVGDRYGECLVRRTDAEIEVRLDADAAVRVRTLDGDGRPVAGVRVLLSASWRRDGAELRPWSTLLLPSDAEGLAQLPHAQLLSAGRIGARLGRPELAGAVLHSLTLQPQLTGGDGAQVVQALVGQRLPTEPIPVPVPPFASIELQLRGPDGAAFAVVPDEWLQAVLAPKEGAVRPWEAHIHKLPWAADGSARFERVLVGEQFELLGRTDWHAGRRFVGPQRAGQVLRVDVPIEPGSRWLEGRLVREDGSPWPHGGELRRGSQQRVPADAGGRFLVPMASWRSDLRTFVHAGELATELVLPAAPGPGRNAVGDVVLKPLPLLVAGRIVVGGVADPPALLATLRVRIQSWPPGQAFGRPTWRPVSLDREGRFEVRGLADETDYKVLVDGNVTGQCVATFEPGARDLELAVDAAVRLQAGLLVAPEWSSLMVTLRKNGDAGELVTSTMFGPAADGRHDFEVEGLVDGEYRLLAAAGGLALAERVVTIAGGLVQDAAALAAIDLRGVAQQLAVRVTDPAGVPCRDVSIAWRPVGADDTQWRVEPYADRDGQGAVLVVPGAVDLAVWATGHAVVEQAAAVTALGIVLRPLPQLTLHWPAAASLPIGTTVALLWERDGSPVSDVDSSPELRAAAMVAAARRGGVPPVQLQDGKVTFGAAAGSRLQLRLQLRGVRTAEPIAVLPGALDAGTWRDGEVVDLQVEPARLQAALRQSGASDTGGR